MIRKASIQELAKLLRTLKEDNKSAILFLGAGASRSAGVPLAGELADILINHRKYGSFMTDLSDKGYVSCMTKLPAGYRKQFLKEYTETARINQAHLYAAALVKQGYIDTIATVNFDQLMVKALSLVNIYPNVYDLAASKGFILGGIETPSVAYLHGQSYGFWQFNTKSEMEYGAKNVNTFFTSQLANKAIIVLGYSGADPVFEILSQIEKFEFGLYWIGYQYDAPNQNVQTFLETANKECYLIEGYNADTFMDGLKKELKVAEPNILSKPFSHVKESLEIIGDFELQGKTKILWTKNVLEWVNAAIEGFEEGRGFTNMPQFNDQNIQVGILIEKAKEILSNRNYDKVTEIENDIQRSGNADAQMYLAFIYDDWGTTLFMDGRLNNNLPVIQSAIEKFRKSIEFKPDLFEAYSNLGSALGEFAILVKSEKIFEESIQMLRKANELAYDNWSVHFNLANMLSRAPRFKNVKEEFIDEAIKNLERAKMLNPDIFQIYGLLGKIWLERAKRNNFELKALEKAVFNFNEALIRGGKGHIETVTKAALAKANLGYEKKDIDLVIQAIDLYKIAYNANPENLMIIVNYGLALKRLTIFTNSIDTCNQAIDLFQKGLKFAPEDQNIINLLSEAKAIKERVNIKQ
ncbi:hypothetical protein PV783_24805 [Chitinophaga sp. CC14]|uniref:SIR2 family protein n=1 Tax=Chitinophaga sp. CC14 TaxID=3029199 RepID=UPI003B7D51B3